MVVILFFNIAANLSCLIMISTIYGLNCYHTSPEKPVHSFYHRLVCSNIKKQNDDHISKSNDVTKTMDTVTWNDVGEILDNVFFHFYLILLVTMYTAYIINVVK
jgi:hypothetical protein